MLNSDCFSTPLKCSHTCSCLKRKMKKTESERRTVGERKDRDVSSAVAVLLKCTNVQNRSYIRPRCDTRPESKCTAWQSCDWILTFCAQNHNCFTANLLLRNCKSSEGFFFFSFFFPGPWTSAASLQGAGRRPPPLPNWLQQLSECCLLERWQSSEESD